MYGASLPIAFRKRKSKKITTLEAAESEAFEPHPKNAKKERAASQGQ